MLENENLFSLKGGETYITENASDAYKILDGSVLVYIVPLKDNGIGRRSFIYQAEKNEVIPSFAYKDNEYKEWRFCFAAVDTASLKVIQNGSTKLLRKRFAEKAMLKNYEKEGFNGGLADQYRFNTVTEDGFIRRTQSGRESTSDNIQAMIYRSFSKKSTDNMFEYDGESSSLYDAMKLLCKKQGIAIAPYEKIKEVLRDEHTVSDIARISHFSYREIVLSSGWIKQDGGSFLAFGEDGRPIVCLSKGAHSYRLWDVENGVELPADKRTEASISKKAYMLYTPFPDKQPDKKDILRFCLKKVRASDIVLLALMTVIMSLIGILTPCISQSIYDTYIPLGEKNIIIQIGCLLLSFMIANVIFSIVKNAASFRISSRISYDIQNAVYDRLFNLPESFFRKYESADLAQRVLGAGALASRLVNTVLSMAAALIIAAVYLVIMLGYSVVLTLAGAAMLLLFSAVYYLIAVRALKYKTSVIEYAGKTSSIMFQLLSGISKIRIAGAEDYAVYQYLKPYVHQRNTEEKRERISGLGDVLIMISGSIFSIVFYLLIIKGGASIGLGAFIAFSSLFGAFSAYFLQLVNAAVSYKSEKPNINRLMPVLSEPPEYYEAKELPVDISGEIEINNVSFAYEQDGPLVLDKISLNIKPGEYVGIIGPSGCGKSTLMKLMLGFEKPTHGKIYYDNKDLESLDKRELRKKMGVVLQSGKLISGSIFDNITITAPRAEAKDVERVIEAVGLKDDIDAMPMGLYTLLSEDSDIISGGQQQRILIARAIISNPKILFFDEATSALDNITQGMVCSTLEKMNATRIVIAHRLSTIIKCDRIIVIDKGRIVEQGTYEELMNNRSLFYKLASRQII